MIPCPTPEHSLAIDSLPQERRLKGERLTPTIGLATALLCAVGGALFVAEPLWSEDAHWIGALTAGGFCLALSLTSLWFSAGAALETRVSLSREHVHTERRSVFRTARWEQPIAAYRGLSLRTGFTHEDRGGLRGVYHVRLEHARPGYTLELMTTASSAEAERYLQLAAATFALPTLEI